MNDYELALTIPEPTPMRFDKHGHPAKEYFTARLNGKEITRSSRWWAMFHKKAWNEDISNGTVQQKVKKGWNQENACLAFKRETEQEVMERLGKIKPIRLDVKASIERTFFSRRLVE